jgi:hypothetical protein
MKKRLRRTLGFLALVLTLTAAMPIDKSIHILNLLGKFPCCKGEVTRLGFGCIPIGTDQRIVLADAGAIS